jgi:hypothetical protein
LTTLQERSLAAPGLQAAIIVGKYCDYRMRLFLCRC